jgi:hypothetical protein
LEVHFAIDVKQKNRRMQTRSAHIFVDPGLIQRVMDQDTEPQAADSAHMDAAGPPIRSHESGNNSLSDGTSRPPREMQTDSRRRNFKPKGACSRRGQAKANKQRAMHLIKRKREQKKTNPTSEAAGMGTWRLSN